MRIGAHEQDLADALRARGLEVVQQARVKRHDAGVYDIDVACWPLAIEVFVGTGSPRHVAALRERSAALMLKGWAVAYLWEDN